MSEFTLSISVCTVRVTPEYLHRAIRWIPNTSWGPLDQPSSLCLAKIVRDIAKVQQYRFGSDLLLQCLLLGQMDGYPHLPG